MINELPKEKIQAIHDEDLEKFLDGLGILNKLKHGELKCKFCDNSVTLETLHSLFPQSGSIKVVCDNPGCISGLSELLRKEEISL